MYNYKIYTTIILVSILLFTKTLFAQKNLDPQNTIKVLTFNILHGATTKGDFNLDTIANVIKTCDPDFVALQEVDFKTNRAKMYDLATELGWRTKLTPIFGRAMHYDDGEYGEAILSKHSFINSRIIPLPANKNDEPRVALEITTVLPSNDTISFIGTHLDHLKKEDNRIMQANTINLTFRINRYPTILAGDLNAEPESKTMNILESYWTASYKKTKPEPTFPSNAPIKKIDYVLFSSENNWKVLKTQVICDTVASDHCAYLVTLQLHE